MPAEAAQAKWIESATFTFSTDRSRLKEQLHLHQKANKKTHLSDNLAYSLRLSRRF